MRIVRQAKLFFQEGTSDKVYEIDLCESGDGYLVNFRYGRRGAALKEGTKTIFPISIAEAEKVFAALESEKRKKGYVAAGEAPLITAVESKPRGGNDKRKKAIVKLLKAAAAGEEPEHWKVSRIIWRAGDLKIPEAIPYIIQVSDPSDAYNIYSVVWAIGRCGTSKALGFLQNLQQNKTLPQHVQHLLVDALLKLSDSKEKESLLGSIIESLPGAFKKSVLDKDYRQLEKDLRDYLFHLKTASNDYLVSLYRLSREDASFHKIFLKVLEEVKLEVNYFKHIRQILKIGEMLQDHQTVGVILKQIEKQPARYKAASWMTAEQKKSQAFSTKTKAYLTGRGVRQLKKYGEAGEDSYAALAAEILLAFDDRKDYTAPHHTSQFTHAYDAATRTHRSQENRTEFDAYSRFQAFNFVLYKNSSRYRPEKQAWVCVAPYKPGDPAPTNREEAYPHLWNNAGEEIIQLLSFCKTSRVQEFGLKVWKANSAFEELVTTADIINFLNTQYHETQRIGLDLAQKIFNRTSPDTLLLVALLDSNLAEARSQAEQWIVQLRTTLLQDVNFLSALLKMRKAEAHGWLRGFLTTTSFSMEQAQIIIAQAIAFFVTAVIENEEDQRYISQAADTLVISFGDHLKDISLEIIKDLFRHPSAEIHALAGKILMKHKIQPEHLPEDFLQLLLQSENANSRGIGIALLEKFPAERLLERKEILVSFCLSPLADVRNAVKPIILKLTKAYPDFGKELVNLFVPAFLMKESYEGLHDDLLNLLSNELGDSLNIIPKEKTLVLLNSRYRTSQQIGQVLLRRNVKDDELTVPELVKLGSNPLQEVRTFVWNIFKKYPEKIKADKEAALKITDTFWDDTRIFSFDFFRDTFIATDWNTDLLIMLCDSTKEDVQAFAREMITKFFQAQQGTTYLLKLSQHPSTKVQLFTTAYLEQFAADNVEVLTSLKLYFVTLLSQVNKGSVAKKRVFAFLRKEAEKNETIASLAADIFSRVSISMALSERAECIAALRGIQRKFPAIKSPVVLQEYLDYNKNLANAV